MISGVVENVKRNWRGTHKSTTIWFNTVFVPAAAAALPILLEEVPKLQEYLPENQYKLWMLVLIVGNAVLRFKTDTALADK
jgi:hypothetical protein